jgi:hypothetical protein
VRSDWTVYSIVRALESEDFLARRRSVRKAIHINMYSFIILVINEMGGACSAYWDIGESCKGFWWKNLRVRYHSENQAVGRRIILRRIFCKWDVGVWTGSSWLRIGTGGGNLRMR